ncbi:TolC family protein [Legionella taurinensis]|uniref:Cobalt transporter n=1 Tax=Legionella taurinensis TaxID=70611 RepID=A0AB38N536_9GAMM|nr:TolC family protein [Legionella taurinensis]MDX1837967.1 TolC family protein [Legionella taurinensis]PUT39443.1 cobalt transporter [Legionella taurinensis]PUT41752.1 cobalt transporter [Legionella taurinensis]PUT44586.1 cobalt transporter [Legionella taurinensis]PUT46830.1 cobalt transporter [Legionella taurinensis]
MRLFLFYIMMIAHGCCAATAAKPLTFPEALQLAYRHNPELQVAIAEVERLKGSVIQSGLLPNPSISLEAENIGGSGQYQGYESAETTLSVTQPIPLGHRLHYLRSAAYAGYVAGIARLRVKKMDIYSRVGMAYVDALYAAQWYTVTRKLTRLHHQIVSEIKRRNVAGAGTELDLRLAEIRFYEAKIRENRARREMLLAEAMLDRVMGVEKMKGRPLTDRGLSHQKMQWRRIVEKMPESPVLKEKRLLLNARRAEITAVKKEVWPNLVVQLGGRHFSDDGNNAAVVSTSSQVPVFDRNQGRIAAAEAQYTQVLQEINVLRLQLKQQLYQYLLEWEQNVYEAERVARSLLPLARKAVKLAEEGYKQGRYTYLELSQALTMLYQEEKHYQQAHANYHKALIQMTGILGISTTRKRTC